VLNLRHEFNNLMADLVGGVGVESAARFHYRTFMNYKVVVHREPKGGYWAEVPALPGCVSEGDTLDELQVNVREAMAGYLEVLREEGRQPEDIQVLEIRL
jgi:predicted RNase H-like HicB family nuclease